MPSLLCCWHVGYRHQQCWGSARCTQQAGSSEPPEDPQGLCGAGCQPCHQAAIYLTPGSSQTRPPLCRCFAASLHSLMWWLPCHQMMAVLVSQSRPLQTKNSCTCAATATQMYVSQAWACVWHLYKDKHRPFKKGQLLQSMQSLNAHAYEKKHMFGDLWSAMCLTCVVQTL